MRRASLIGIARLASAAVVSSSLAQPAPARKAPLPAAKVFPYLDRYLKLPAAERTLFAPMYMLRRDHGPPRDLKLWLVDGGGREPIPVGADGRVERQPTLAQLNSAKIEFDAPAATRLGVPVIIVASLRPSTEMNAADLARAVRQADTGIHKAAGLMAVMAPRLDRAVFPGATGAQAIMSGGATTPLPGGDAPYADLPLLAKAVTLKFTRPPSRVELDGAPKK